MRYTAEVEHYNLDLYAIKFYLKSHQNSKDKFTVLTNLHEARPVIYTCIAILIDSFIRITRLLLLLSVLPLLKKSKEKKESSSEEVKPYSTVQNLFYIHVHIF